MDFVNIKYDFTEPLLEGVKKEDYYDVICEHLKDYFHGPYCHSYSEDGKSITLAYSKDCFYIPGLTLMYYHALKDFRNGNYKRARILITDILKFTDPKKEYFAQLESMLKEAEEKLGCPKRS